MCNQRPTRRHATPRDGDVTRLVDRRERALAIKPMVGGGRRDQLFKFVPDISNDDPKTESTRGIIENNVDPANKRTKRHTAPRAKHRGYEMGAALYSTSV